MSGETHLSQGATSGEGDWAGVALPSETLQRLAALPIPAWVPREIPRRYEFEGLSLSASDFGDMYVLWFRASDDEVFGVTGVPGGIGSVLPGDRQTPCAHATLGGGGVEWYDDPDATWAFSSPWLGEAEGLPVFGVFGRGLQPDEVARVVKSLDRLPRPA